jgi:hypothetical protein
MEKGKPNIALHKEFTANMWCTHQHTLGKTVKWTKTNSRTRVALLEMGMD